MLNAGKVPAGGILDGRLGKRVAVPADTSGTCTRLGDQGDGVVLCEGRGKNVLLTWLSLHSYPEEDNNVHGDKKNPGARRSVSGCLLRRAS